MGNMQNMQAPFPMDANDDDDMHSHSHASMQQSPYADINHSMLSQSSYNNNIGLNELKNRDIANSFSALINQPTNNNSMLVDDNNNNNKYEPPQIDDEPMDDESVYESLDDRHEEIPDDTIIFHEQRMHKYDEEKQDINENKINNDEYYPNTTILKDPNPNICANDISKQFEKALKSQLDLVLQEEKNNNNDFMMNGLDDRKSNWESYDLGFRNKSMMSALIKNGKLYNAMNRQYFAKDKIANFHELKESNRIQIRSIISGLEKIFGKQIYLELIDKLLNIHKQYYFDRQIDTKTGKEIQWKNKSSGDKLQDLCDSYCQQIQYMLLYLQNNNNKKSILGKKILTKFYDALQLILALYAPRCGSGEQSLLKIPKQQIIVHDMIHNNINELDDDDKKMSEPKEDIINEYIVSTELSYNELFARKISITKWLQDVIKEEVDNELKKFDAEIEKVKNGMFEMNENEDEKQQEEKDNNNNININKMSDIEKKQEINGWIDEK
eukprot:285378_1